MIEPISPAVDLVRRYGGAVSHAALDPTRSLFRVPGIDGLIGFLNVRGCAVVMGDPICAPEHQAALADAFAADCADKGWSILYVAASASLQAQARERGYASMAFAGLLIADPRHDPEAGHSGRHLRQHLNHTRRMGVTAREYLAEPSPDAQLEAQAQAACDCWRANRHGPQMYLGCPRLFDDRPGRRWFIAEQAGSVVGLLSMLKVGCAECGSLINRVFSSPAAPPHTNELMVITALRALREEGIDAVCLGVGPLAALGRMEGCGGVTEFVARNVYRWVANMMRLHNKTVYWEKYQVARGEPLYLLFQPPRIGLRELNALFRAFHFSIT